MRLRQVIFDFDGTSTLVEPVQEAFLAEYRRLLVEGVSQSFADAWDDALQQLAKASPEAAWSTLSTVPAAPAYADPYIAASESVAWVQRQLAAMRLPIPSVPGDLYRRAYERCAAPFRAELPEVLESFVSRGIGVSFISNSSEVTIRNRLADLLRTRPALEGQIAVRGDAKKFVTRELHPEEARALAPWMRKAFQQLKPAQQRAGLERPIYLRRADYFRALCRSWSKAKPSETLVVGDIYELDLAMPIALGCRVHLIERGAPFATQAYERSAVKAAKGRVSKDLTPLLDS
ncbi:MAG: hypothetical protein U1E65_21050 [Myxococcota bacterium]